jgi:hypothetical protein
VELAYAMTTHKAEGLTVSADWQTPEGRNQRGTALVHGAGTDEAAMYVAMSRHKDQAFLFAAPEQVENQQTGYAQGKPRDDVDRARRVVSALAEKARVTRDNAEDQPVLGDLGRVPEPGKKRTVHEPDERQEAEPEQVENERQRATRHDASRPSARTRPAQRTDCGRVLGPRPPPVPPRGAGRPNGPAGNRRERRDRGFER